MHESSQPARNKFRRPQCCEQLIMILGRTPRDRGQLLLAGAHRPDKSPSNGSPRTPPSLSNEPVLPPSSHQPSKRVHREYSVNSPRSKNSSQTSSVEECLEDLGQFIREARSQKARYDNDAHDNDGQQLSQCLRHWDILITSREGRTVVSLNPMVLDGEQRAGWEEG